MPIGPGYGAKTQHVFSDVESNLVVGLNSTCLSEAFGLGKKVLWCNLKSYERFAVPEANILFRY